MSGPLSTGLHDNWAPASLFRVRLRFEGGVEADLDLGELSRFEGVFAPLCEPRCFAELRSDPELGTICWPGGAVLDPDVLYAFAAGRAIDMGHSG